MRDVSLRVGVSESPVPGVSFIPRFSRHTKYLSNKAILSGVQNFAIAIGKPGGMIPSVSRLSQSTWGAVDAPRQAPYNEDTHQ